MFDDTISWYVSFRIDDGQADYADFPITNTRVDKPMEFVPWDTEKNKKTPLWTGDWDHPLGVEGPQRGPWYPK